MCIFSNSVSYVGGTRILARRVSPNRQALVYQMEVSLDHPVAMILPLPVALPSREDSVRFVSLKQYEFFFNDVDRLFPTPPRAAGGGGEGARPGAPSRRLAVREIGDFVASFVPTQADFQRLDPRFVLRPEVWKQLPRYEDYGFAVFQLKAPEEIRKEAGVDGRSNLRVQVHPMAFSFETRHADQLYFPTVHIHDGKVHPQEAFDHTLFAQPARRQRNAATERSTGWMESMILPETTVRTELTKGMLDPKARVLKRNIRGMQKNDDTWLPG